MLYLLTVLLVCARLVAQLSAEKNLASALCGRGNRTDTTDRRGKAAAGRHPGRSRVAVFFRDRAAHTPRTEATVGSKERGERAGNFDTGRSCRIRNVAATSKPEGVQEREGKVAMKRFV